MGVGVQREGGIGVAQDAEQRLGIYAAGESMGCEGVPKLMQVENGKYSIITARKSRKQSIKTVIDDVRSAVGYIRSKQR